MKYQGVYDKSPILLQNVMATIYGYKVNRTRFNSAYHKFLAQWNEYKNYSENALIEYQNQEFIRLLRFAVNNSAFYKEHYRNVDIDSIKNIEDIINLPILEKEALRINIDEIRTISKKEGIESTTGGTTGKSLTVYFNSEDMQKRMAILDSFKLMHGFKNLEMKKATFGGKHIIPPTQTRKVFWRYNMASKQMLYSVFQLKEENLPYYIKSLEAYQPAVLDGYTSAIYEIARYIDFHKLDVKLNIKAIFPTAEPTNSEHRRLLEKVFKCKVYDQYASSEGAPFIYECSHGNLHFDVTTGVIENYENSSEMLITSFTTYGTPLIRYRIGDGVIFDDPSKKCTCGLNMPLVKSIEGRTNNFLYAIEGYKVSEAAAAFEANPLGVRKYQIVQNEYKHVEVNIVKDEHYKYSSEAIFLDELKHKLGRDINVSFKYVDNIPREKSGKFSIIKNNVKEVI